MEGYDLLVRLVSLFARNQEFHDDPMDAVSLPEGTAWNVLKKNNKIYRANEFSLYQSIDYSGNWFVRKPQPGGNYRQFVLIDADRAVTLMVLNDSRCDTLLRTEDVRQRICTGEVNGLLVKRPEARAMDEIYLCGDPRALVMPVVRHMYFLDIVDDATQCLFCKSAELVLDKHQKPYAVNRKIMSEEERGELAVSLGRKKILFPVVYYVDVSDDSVNKRPMPSNYIGGYEELLMHIKSSN